MRERIWTRRIMWTRVRERIGARTIMWTKVRIRIKTKITRR